MIAGRGHKQRALALIAGVLLALAGCTVPEPGVDGSPTRAPAARPVTSTAVSPLSQDLRRYYARFEQRQQSRGLLRTDGGGPDTPYDADDLARNFERIALFNEYTLRNGTYVAQQNPSRLRRWDGPVRVEVIHGNAIPAEQRQEDRAAVAAYVERLARVSGADLRMVAPGLTGNYFVLFLTADEQRAAEPLLKRLVPGIDASTVRDITDMDRFTFCSVYAFSTNYAPDIYTTAVAVIRDEHPPLIRRACIHEELAQGLGLANDSPDARPSIFNDDDEFALLTSHDEQLLRMLYDIRLRPGMNAEDARGIIANLAAEVSGGES